MLETLESLQPAMLNNMKVLIGACRLNTEFVDNILPTNPARFAADMSA